MCSVVTCCHRRWLQQVQQSHLHLFLVSLQREKLTPLGKWQKENVQRRLIFRFSLSGTGALSQIPSSLRAQEANIIYLKDKFKILCRCVVLAASLCW